jgi:hypothetical protein
MDWRLIILIKIFISRLPLPYKFWKGIGLFQHGQMNTSDYSQKIFNMHFKHFLKKNSQSGFNMLELGPGDSALSALYGYLNGAKKIYLLDVGNFASTDMDIYERAFENWCKKNELKTARPNFSCFNKFLSSINAFYFVNGVKSFEKIKDNSIDFVFSHSVLEHIRKAEINQVFSELFRVSKAGVICSHNVDYMDHLGGAQNNLRFSDALWESSFFAESGFYTNRISAHVLHQKVRDAGFTVLRERFGTWKGAAAESENIHPDLKDEYVRELSAPTSSMLLSK